ncbi:transposase [Lichenifustis flavocetrariae]|uniref:transposase n=1 Tax=Lichenifustis flavocetrariae TaxID=2949735 RepID=UPI003D096716
MPMRLIPQATPGGHPHKTDMCAAMTAIFYLQRTGGPWRSLPRDNFPPHAHSRRCATGITLRER